MTNEEIRIAVAEEMGWRKRMTTETLMHFPGGMRECEVERWFANDSIVAQCVREDDLPDYPNSLDACAEFEATVKDWPKYLGNLARAIAGCDSKTKAYVASSLMVPATARQRCEAFLRLRGKWKEDK